MASPVAATRQNPTLTKMADGFRTYITLTVNPSIEFWEVSVTPPGIDGGEPTDTTNMHNNLWRTFHARKLIKMDNVVCEAEYNPALYTDILAVVNVATTITVLFPDHSTLAMFGYLKSFKPAALEDGKVPTCSVEFVVTNADPTTCVEAGPVYTSASGTGGC